MTHLNRAAAITAATAAGVALGPLALGGLLVLALISAAVVLAGGGPQS